MMSRTLQCLLVDDDEMSLEVLESFVDRHDALALADKCTSAIDAFNILEYGDIDLVFLDVEMPEMNGLELLRGLDNRPHVILISGEPRYAVDGFQEDVVDYLLKPITYSRFIKAVARVKREIPDEFDMENRGHVFIKSNGRLIRLELKNIQWVEAQSDYMMIHTVDGKFLIHSTMKKLAEKLPEDEFVRVHRSYIVRFDQISDMDEQTLVIERKVIPIGASYKERLLSKVSTL